MNELHEQVRKDAETLLALYQKKPELKAVGGKE